MAEDGEVGFDVEESFEETLEDADAEIHELKSILTEALGDMPFKVAIGFIVILNFLYTSYGVFFGSTIGTENLINNGIAALVIDCSIALLPLVCHVHGFSF